MRPGRKGPRRHRSVLDQQGPALGKQAGRTGFVSRQDGDGRSDMGDELGQRVADATLHLRPRRMSAVADWGIGELEQPRSGDTHGDGNATEGLRTTPKPGRRGRPTAWRSARSRPGEKPDLPSRMPAAWWERPSP